MSGEKVASVEMTIVRKNRSASPEGPTPTIVTGSFRTARETLGACDPHRNPTIMESMVLKIWSVTKTGEFKSYCIKKFRAKDHLKQMYSSH